MYTFISHSEQETKEIAYKLAKKLHTGDILVLSGELGSGKTKFTEGFLSCWGLESEISSPTFTIVNEHTRDDTHIYHLDVYRLTNIGEFYSIGGPEYFANGICVIEWGDLIEDILPPNYIKIKFTKDKSDENTRHLEFISYDSRLETIINSILLKDEFFDS